ncbi:unnamed protein product [Cunninghamella blakesleeana]
MEQPQIEYTKKARHGHGNNVVNEDNIRQVAGCLPIDLVNKRILLISSSKHKGRFVIPKGGWEEDETQAQAAVRETWEEAGIKGRILRQLGVFEEATKKQVKAHHWVFEMEIQEVCKKFPEKKKRERRWFTYEEALQVVQQQYIKDALQLSRLNPSPNNMLRTEIPPIETKMGNLNIQETKLPPSSTMPPISQEQIQKEKEKLEQEKLKIQKEKLYLEEQKKHLEKEKHLLQEQQTPPAPSPEKNERHHIIPSSIKAFFKK